MIMIKRFGPLSKYKDHFPLLAALLLAAPILFLQALRYSYPLGYAGMFTLIAEQIAGANFQLPMSVPHYGPGGIPLVYPPFAMYLYALGIKMGISTWTYMRLVPPFFTLLSVIPLYYLTFELVKSRVAGVLAVIFVMSAPAVYYTHVWSAGVVRGLALVFCLSGLYFYLRSLRHFSGVSLFLAGLSLGLLLTTHLLYVLFAALVGLAFLISEGKPARLPTALGTLLLALLVASPWLFLILDRHGAAALFAAYSSHRNVDFFLSLRDFSLPVQFLLENLGHVTDNPFLTALAFPGFVMLIVQRKFHLPLAFLLILSMGEASFFTEILAGMMAGAFSAEILRLTLRPDTGFGKLVKWLPAVLVALFFLLAVRNGLARIAGFPPEVDALSLQTASFVRNNTDPESSYLFIGKINEAEWFPYLFDRTPVFSPWGSEWKGSYAEQSEILIALRECELRKDWACMEKIEQEQNVSPGLLVIPNKRWLIQEVRETDTWDLLYRDERYLVWERID